MTRDKQLERTGGQNNSETQEAKLNMTPSEQEAREIKQEVRTKRG